jgi:NAD(P)-dependent dehydrogenase (short-subunit alcohol dehydrogenase family)
LRTPPGFDLYSKVVWITGSGLAIAREFAAAGCRLALTGNDPVDLERARLDLLARNAHVFTTRCDLTNLAQVDGAVEAVLNRYGQLDILVNNPGVIEPANRGELSLADFERAMEVMFWGVVYPTRAALPYMIERRAGRIVNLVADSRVSSHLLPRDCANLAATGFSAGLRAELAPQGITVVTLVSEMCAENEIRAARRVVTATIRGQWRAAPSPVPRLT